MSDYNYILTGMGSSFGLLYSAIQHIKPDIAVVLTSERFADKVIEICQKTSVSIDSKNIHIVKMNDVFCGFNETEELLSQIWEKLYNLKNLTINITGGTTAMQWIMQSAYEKAVKEKLNTTRVAFVDRRPAVEQQKDPYILGEIIKVDEIIKSSSEKSIISE